MVELYLQRRGVRALLLAALLATPAALAAQTIEVTVLNSDTRQPLPARPVTLQNTALGLTRGGTTNEQGKVRFTGLGTGGSYTVEVEGGESFKGQTLGGIVLRANTDRAVTVALLPRSTGGQKITVTARREVELNALNAEVSASLSARQIDDLPVEGRDITRVLYRLPNVTQATGFFSEAPNVSINGVNGLYASYLIDGLDNNENFLGGPKFAIPSGFTQNVTVLTNTYSTEYGRTGNGVFNVTTKTGSNKLTGEAFYLTRPGPAIDASSPFAQRDLTGNQVKNGFQRQQFGLALGGAIVPSQTFFYADIEQTFDTKDNLLNVLPLGVNTAVRGRNSYTYGSGKITHFWNSEFFSTLRVNVGEVDIDRQGGGLEGGVSFPSSANTQRRSSLLVGSQNILTGSDYTFEANVGFSRFHWDYANPANPNSPQVVVLDSGGATVAVLGHPGYVFDDVENSINGQLKYARTLGDHRVKVGAEILSSDFQLAGGGNPNGNYVVQLSGAQQRSLAAANRGADLGINDIPSDVRVTNYNVELRPASFGARQNVLSAYVEDLFSVNSDLNVTLGLRWDYDDLSRGGGTSGDLNNIAPRVSANYKLDESSVLRAGYGIFYDKILYAVYSDALQQNSTSAGYRQQIQMLIDRGILPANTDIERVTFDGNLSANLDSVGYLRGPDASTLQGQRAGATADERRILNPNGYQNPFTHQMTLGWQRQLGEDMLLGVDLIHTRAENQYVLVDLNAPTPYEIDAAHPAPRSQAAADSTRPVPVLAGGAKKIVMSETSGRARYYAATVSLAKQRGEDRYSFRLAYTLSRSENNTEDINFKAADANNFEREWGPSVNDRTHVINAVGTWYPIDELSITLAALVQSGQPINRVVDGNAFGGVTDLNGDGSSYGDQYVGNVDRTPGEARNSDRLPWSKQFDASVQYAPEVLNGRIELRADVFNLFNTVNYSGYSNNATQSNQIQIGRAGDAIVYRNAGPPRQFQFGVRYLF